MTKHALVIIKEGNIHNTLFSAITEQYESAAVGKLPSNQSNHYEKYGRSSL